MAHAYTPGLKVAERTKIVKERRLPIPGEILVEKGVRVKGEDIVARTNLPGNVKPVNVCGLLGVPPEDIREVMLKKEGDRVEENEIIAQTKGFFGLFKSVVKSPIKGTIESISEITGQVIIREEPQPVQVTAYIDGVVEEIIPNQGVRIETYATLIQGIFGIGGEARGEIMPVASSPDEVLDEKSFEERMRGKVVIGGSLITLTGMRKAKELGVKGVVVGGIEDETIKEFLGYDIGVAITGHENCGITLIVTEGFGRMRMAKKTFDLLSSLVGKVASINGATQIRAGVMRPEVIVAQDGGGVLTSDKVYETGLEVGMTVRIIREPYFGLLGKVVSLPAELQEIETESKVRILEVELEDGRRITLPRANVEIFET
ncbi:MAG: hypothetical protein ABIK99_03160 [candidate division WOR-3 bacterium]